MTNPTVDQLAALMRARTQGELAYQGTFNEETLPTAEQAAAAITLAATIVTPKLGSRIPDEFEDAARTAILFKAAALVEVTYYPEQANAEDSAYALYQGQYEELIAALELAEAGEMPNTPKVFSVVTLGRNGRLVP